MTLGFFKTNTADDVFFCFALDEVVEAGQEFRC